MSTQTVDAFAVAAPGLADITARELASLGLTPTRVEAEGVSFTTDLPGLYAANVHLRTASRVVIRLAAFPARTFAELERKADRTPWTQWLRAGQPVALRVSARKSRLYHTGAIEERLGRILLAHGMPLATSSPESQDADDDRGDQPAQLVLVRFARDQCVVSLDASGALLHRRGYREAVGKAPLRETLAAAMLLAARYDPARPLVDPMCGSGTLPIEAALIARRIPPGLRRTFAFEQWPTFDPAALDRLRRDASAAIRDRTMAPIVGSDRDAGVIAAAVANAGRAGLAQEDVAFIERPISAVTAPDGGGGPGLVVSNPPYGVRVGDAARLRDLYARLGDVMRAAFHGWRIALLSADKRLTGATGLPFETLFTTINGGLPVTVVAATVGARGEARAGASRRSSRRGPARA